MSQNSTTYHFTSNRRFYEGTRGWMLLGIILSGVIIGWLLWPILGVCTAVPLLGIVFFLRPSYQIRKGMLIKYHGKQTGARIRLKDVENIERTARGLKIWYSPHDFFNVYSDEAEKMREVIERGKGLPSDG